MFGLFGANDRPLLMATIKTVVVIAVLSVLATKYLADGAFDQAGLTRLAGLASNGKAEPTTTGSILRSSAAARIDPCIGAQRP